jgi:hypothetical protein
LYVWFIRFQLTASRPAWPKDRIVLSERQHCFVSMQDLIALLENSDRQALQAAKGGNQIDMESDGVFE